MKGGFLWRGGMVGGDRGKISLDDLIFFFLDKLVDGEGLCGYTNHVDRGFGSILLYLLIPLLTSLQTKFHK